jgi:predicted Zn finger-like uncharacterized protein
MSIRTACPDCRAPYNLPDTQAGKRVRCGACGSTFLVKQAAPRRRDEDLPAVEVVKEPRPRPRTAPAVEIVEGPRPRGRSSSTPPPGRRPGGRRDEDEDERPTRRRDDGAAGGSNLPWIIGGAGAGVGVLAAGILAVVLLTRDKPADTDQARQAEPPPAQVPPGGGVPVSNPPKDPAPVVPPPVDPIITPPPEKPKDPPPPPRDPGPARSGELSKAARDKVKRATVYIRVTMPDGSKATGSGFFGASDARNIVLTNAHVVGMLAAESRKPTKVEIILNSGEKDERVLGALVLGVDRDSDLAVLDLGSSATGLPEPLVVRSAEGVSELDKVYVFGFPFGEGLGKEITIRPSSVSSLRKKGGVLDKIQVNGGMDPGNSGGPVVDTDGNVVGVAVSGIPGRQINFAIPGDRVHTVLNGRIAAMGLGQPFIEGGKTGVPVNMEMIDPRARVKSVGLEVWAGNAPPNPREGTRPPAKSAPPVLPGDSAHQRHTLDKYLGGVGKGEVTLPELPTGKVWWVQPFWTYTSGETRWASANVYRPASPPVERKPADLVMRHRNGTRSVNLSISNTFRVGNDEDSVVGEMRNRVALRETVSGANAFGALVRVRYQSADRSFVHDKKVEPSRALPVIRPHLPNLIGVLRVDAYGNLTHNTVDELRLAGNPVARQLIDFHEPVRYSLDTLAIPLPGKKVVAGESWPADGAERQLGVVTPVGVEKANVKLTYTYLGRRTNNGREEAVISVDGVVRQTRHFGGRVGGTVVVDLTAGQIAKADVQVKLDFQEVAIDLGGKVEKIKAMATQVVHLERALR